MAEVLIGYALVTFSFILAPFPEGSRGAVPQKDNKPHNSKIIQEEKYQRFFKIEERKLGLQKKISGDVSADQGIYAIGCNQNPD